MKKKVTLYSEIDFSRKKFFYYKKSHNFLFLKKKITSVYENIRKIPKGTVALRIDNKLEFLIKFYALNRANFSIYLTNSKSIKELKREKINIDYVFKKRKLYKIKIIKTKKIKNVALILKTSGSTSNSKYVYLSNSCLSFVTGGMNKAMYNNKNFFNELLFAPIDHAFGFGRFHALMKSKNSFIMVDEFSFSSLYDNYKFFKADSLSIPAKVLLNCLEKDYINFKKKLNNLFYAQVSTGYFPTKMRKKLLNKGTNLFVNYGMTEAMRSTFLDCKKYPKKIHTEGKPFSGALIRIYKKNKKDKIGQIFLKGKHLARGYSEAKLWKLNFDGKWFKTTDLGYLDKDNFLIFHGRNNNTININGVNYFLDDIENLLKKKFKNIKYKILNISNSKNYYNSELYLFVEKLIDMSQIQKILKQNKINISFRKQILIKNFKFEKTGKLNIKNLINLVKNDK